MIQAETNRMTKEMQIKLQEQREQLMVYFRVYNYKSMSVIIFLFQYILRLSLSFLR